MEGPFLQSLNATFKPEARKELKALELSLKEPSFREERIRLEAVVGDLIEEINDTLLTTAEAVRESLGCDIKSSVNPEEEGQEKRRWFSRLCTKHAINDYKKRVSCFLVFTKFFLLQETRECTSVNFDSRTLVSLEAFHRSEKTRKDICQLFLTLLKGNRFVKSTYNREVLCLFPLTVLLSEDCRGFFNAESAQKTVSSLKFLCRGSALLHIEDLNEGQVSEYKALLQDLSYYTGATHAFACLFRFHKGLNNLSTPSSGKVSFFDGGKMFVENVDFSPVLLSQTFLGLVQETERLPLVPANVNTVRGAKALLADSIRYEESAVVLMHFLIGFSSRATDYQNLRLADLVSLNSGLYLLRRTCKKTTLLRGVKNISPVVLPKRFFGSVVKYYNEVRPLCVQAAKRLSRSTFNGKSKFGSERNK